MRMYDIIMKKRKGYELSKEEIDDIMKYLVEEQGVETLRYQALKLVKEGKTKVDEFNKIIAYID